jgi:glycosyltransferase involved in cell wall biosynthesis
MIDTSRINVIIPARNEAPRLPWVLERLRQQLPDAQVIVVDDGSSDETAAVAYARGAQVLRHPYGMGNGAALKNGIRNATGEVLVLMDGDGQHDPADIPRLLATLDQGFDMAVGARSSASHATRLRRLVNGVFNRVASWMVDHRIADLTSGFRAIRARRARQFLHLLPNGFSSPTTLTMALFRSGLPVAFVPIQAHQRSGRSHIRPLRDTVRFFLIIFRVGALYSPLKLFTPISAALFASGLGYYLYTYLNFSRFSNMSTLLFVSAALVFLIGMVSEQITTLIYADHTEQSGLQQAQEAPIVATGEVVRLRPKKDIRRGHSDGDR